jgi:DHA2 family multidrug resistance protein
MAMTRAPEAQWRPSHHPWLVTLSVLLATFIQVLDTSIANVALPHIAGNLSATVDQATWVLTSYLVSSTIALATAGWMSGIFGRKRYLAISVIVFTLSSALCGLARSLPQLVAARILQGLGGGLQPLAQAIMLESFPIEERGVAMAAYGMGVVVAPIIGPTLGGWITDNYSWRWIFYINVPFGALALFLQNMFVEDPPYLKRAEGFKMDYVGLGLMVVGLSALQIVFDKGQEVDWFSAVWLRWAAVIAVGSLSAFVFWEASETHPVVNIRLLSNRNFAVGSTLGGMLSCIMYGSTALLPIFMQTLLGYPALQCGLAMTPRGLGSFLAMLVVGRLTKLVDNRMLIALGFCGVAATLWRLNGLNLDVAPRNISWPLVLNGFSTGFIFVPLTVLAVSTMQQSQISQATSIYALLRNIGGSIGISALIAMQQRMAQTHQVALVAHLTQTSPVFQERLGGMTSALSGLGVPAAAQTAYQMVYGIVVRQATLLSFMDTFRWLAFISALCAPLAIVFHCARKEVPAPMIVE